VGRGRVSLRLTHETHHLALRDPFHIAREDHGSGDRVTTVTVELLDDRYPGMVGVGEGYPDRFYGETPETMAAVFPYLLSVAGDPGPDFGDPLAARHALERIASRWAADLRWNGAAKCALDLALHDLAGKVLGIPVHALIGLAADIPPTDFTIGIDAPDLVAAGIFSVSVVSTAVYSTASAVFRASSRVRAESANDLVSRVFVILAGSWWLTHGGGLRAAVGVYAIADATSAIVLIGVAWRVTAGSVGSIGRGQFALRRMAPVAVATGIGVLYFRLDLWLLALLRGPRDVAMYGSAYRVLDGVLLAAAAIAALSVPAVARVGADQQRRVIGRLVGLSLALTVPFAVGGVIFAHPMIRVLFGARYEAAAGLLRLLLVAAVPSAVVTVVAPLALLRARGPAVRGFTVTLVTNVGLNLVLIPMMGPTGAAVATLACQAALAAWLWHSVLGWPGGAGGEPASVLPAGTAVAASAVVG